MTLSDRGEGRATLEQLPLFPDTAADLLSARGFVDGRWSRFAGSLGAFEASKGFILTWVARYASPEDAMEAFAILLNELTSDDHYGWDGEDVGLGDEDTCAEGNNPQMGGLHRRSACGAMVRSSWSLAAEARMRRRFRQTPRRWMLAPTRTSPDIVSAMSAWRP